MTRLPWLTVACFDIRFTSVHLGDSDIGAIGIEVTWRWWHLLNVVTRANEKDSGWSQIVRFQIEYTDIISVTNIDKVMHSIGIPFMKIDYMVHIFYLIDQRQYRGVPNMSATKRPNRDRYDSYHMSETEAPPLVLIWLRHLNHSLQRYDWDAKLSVDTNIIETPWPDLAPIWLRQPISDEYIYDCDAFYLWHTYDWDIPTRSCTHMTETPKIFLWFISWHRYDCDGQNFCFLIQHLTQLWLRRCQKIFETFSTWHRYDCDTLRLF